MNATCQIRGIQISGKDGITSWIFATGRQRSESRTLLLTETVRTLSRCSQKAGVWFMDAMRPIQKLSAADGITWEPCMIIVRTADTLLTSCVITGSSCGSYRGRRKFEMWDTPDIDTLLFDTMEAVIGSGRRSGCRKAKASDPDRRDRNPDRVRTSGSEVRRSRQL